MAHRVPGVAREIMRYFTDHPHSIDSLEGIARWRLMQRRIEESVAETATALDWLVQRGHIQRIDVAFGSPLFRIAEPKESK